MPKCTIIARIIPEHQRVSHPVYLFTQNNSYSIELAPPIHNNGMDIILETFDPPPVINSIIRIETENISAEAIITEINFHRPQMEQHSISVETLPPLSEVTSAFIDSAAVGRDLMANMERLNEQIFETLSGDTSASTCPVDTERNFLTDAEPRISLNERIERELGFWENDFLNTARQNNPAELLPFQQLPRQAESRVDRKHPQKRTHKKKRINKKYLKKYGRKSPHIHSFDYWNNFGIYNSGGS